MTGEASGIEQLLASRIGLDPVSVGTQLLWRAVRRRMRELALDDLTAYEHRLRSSEQELEALIEEVVVAESWFFRDERPFLWLRDHVRAGWLNDPVRPPLRVLSLACAGGEEPYSIAMVLSDLGLPTRRFLIDALDISAQRLAIARRAVYSPNAFRGPEHNYRARYFCEQPEGYELASAIRAKVRFLQANVLDPRLLEGTPPYDVLFCRNLLIYLSAPARACVMTAIDRLLAADGVLVIGHADRLNWAGAEARFTAVADPGCFAYRRTAGGNAGLPRLQLDPPRAVRSLVAPSAAPTSAVVTRDLLGTATIAPEPVSAASAGVSLIPESDPPLLDRAAELANQGRFDLAVAICERHLRYKGLTAATYYLMGMICQAAGDRRRAEDCFHKTVYLDPRHDEALLALALLAERRGDDSAAAGFRRRAERTVSMTRKRAN